MGISLDPEPKSKGGRTLALLLLIVAGAVLLWGQRDRLTAPLAGQWLPRSQTPPILPTDTPSPGGGGVKLVYSAVVEADSPAFTADLYLEEAEHPDAPDWAGLGGRTAVLTYTVQNGDTLWGIAARFGLELDTLRWSNPALERNPDLLTPGAELVILPVNGVYHTVAAGETVATIAQRYGVSEADITNYPPNNLSPPYTLQPGQKLIIPNGRKNIVVPTPAPDPDYPLAWPIVGVITQGFGPEHRALDIGSVYGAEVFAADDGTVVHAQWARTGYGFTVIIDHGNNRQTLYSHLKGALVRKGQRVARGEVIGAVGSTGNSTGPHVHFEVREGGERVNPLDYLSPP